MPCGNSQLFDPTQSLFTLQAYAAEIVSWRQELFPGFRQPVIPFHKEHEYAAALFTYEHYNHLNVEQVIITYVSYNVDEISDAHKLLRDYVRDGHRFMDVAIIYRPDRHHTLFETNRISCMDQVNTEVRLVLL